MTNNIALLKNDDGLVLSADLAVLRVQREVMLKDGLENLISSRLITAEEALMLIEQQPLPGQNAILHRADMIMALVSGAPLIGQYALTFSERAERVLQLISRQPVEVQCSLFALNGTIDELSDNGQLNPMFEMIFKMSPEQQHKIACEFFDVDDLKNLLNVEDAFDVLKSRDDLLQQKLLCCAWVVGYLAHQKPRETFALVERLPSRVQGQVFCTNLALIGLLQRKESQENVLELLGQQPLKVQYKALIGYRVAGFIAEAHPEIFAELINKQKSPSERKAILRALFIPEGPSQKTWNAIKHVFDRKLVAEVRPSRPADTAVDPTPAPLARH